jgi:Mg/Co/Ni transporter MgtE
MTVLVDEDVCRERRNTTASEKEYPSLGGTRPEQKGLRRVMAMQEVKARGKWLLILMLFQSGSSFVLSQYATLVREHLVLTLFLTMLVGAGGNAGAQSAMQTLQQLTVDGNTSLRKTLSHQGLVSLCLGVVLAVTAWFRVYFFHGLISSYSVLSRA